MFNLFFPFLGPGVGSGYQPEPPVEPSSTLGGPAQDQSEELATVDRTSMDSLDLDQPAPAPAKALRQESARRARANKAAPQARGPKTAATKRTTARSKGPKSSSAEQSSPQLTSSAAPTTSASVRAEATPPAREAVVQRARLSQIPARGDQRRSAAPLALPAGQRWKRRLPRACW